MSLAVSLYSPLALPLPPPAPSSLSLALSPSLLSLALSCFALSCCSLCSATDLLFILSLQVPQVCREVLGRAWFGGTPRSNQRPRHHQPQGRASWTNWTSPTSSNSLRHRSWIARVDRMARHPPRGEEPFPLRRRLLPLSPLQALPQGSQHLLGECNYSATPPTSRLEQRSSSSGRHAQAGQLNARLDERAGREEASPMSTLWKGGDWRQEPSARLQQAAQGGLGL